MSKLAIQLAGKDLRTIKQYLDLSKSMLSRSIDVLEGELRHLEGATSIDHPLRQVIYRLGQAKAVSKLLDGLIDAMAGIDEMYLLGFKGVEDE